MQNREFRAKKPNVGSQENGNDSAGIGQRRFIRPRAKTPERSCPHEVGRTPKCDILRCRVRLTADWFGQPWTQLRGWTHQVDSLAPSQRDRRTVQTHQLPKTRNMLQGTLAALTSPLLRARLTLPKTGCRYSPPTATGGSGKSSIPSKGRVVWLAAVLALLAPGCGQTTLGGIGKLSVQELCGRHTKSCQATPYPRYVKFSEGLPGFGGDPATLIGRSLDTSNNREPTSPCVEPTEDDFRTAYRYDAVITDTKTLKSTTKFTVKADIAKALAAEFPAVAEAIDLEAAFDLDRVANRVAEKSAKLQYQIIEATNSLWSVTGRSDAERTCLGDHEGGQKSPRHIIGAIAVVTYDATSRTAFESELDAELKAKFAAKALGEGAPTADFEQKWERVKKRVVDGVVAENSYVVSYAWPETY